MPVARLSRSRSWGVALVKPNIITVAPIRSMMARIKSITEVTFKNLFSWTPLVVSMVVSLVVCTYLLLVVEGLKMKPKRLKDLHGRDKQ